MCLKNDRNLALEIERRAESDKTLKQMFLEAIDRTEGNLSSLRAAVDVLTHRVGVLENELRDERTIRQHSIADTATLFEERVSKLQVCVLCVCVCLGRWNVREGPRRENLSCHPLPPSDY